MYLHSYFITGEDMTKDEALRLALEALEYTGLKWPQVEEAITAIKAALEAKDEPVGTAGELFSNTALERLDLRPSTGIYITPPQRTWVVLTDEEVTWLCNTAKSHEQTWGMFVRAIEHKLKEKNT